LADLKENVLKQISDILADFRAQHNHKETSAWARIVFYSVICLQLAKIGECSKIEGPIIATFFLLIFALLIFLFVRKQYNQQCHAVNTNAACISLTAKIISGKKKVEESDCEPAPDDANLKELTNYHIFPKCLLEEIKNMPKDHLIARRYLENLGYWVFIGITILTLYSIWSGNLIKWFNSAYANDAVYYGSGVTVYPVKHDDIQLVSEVITITKGVGLGWGVEAVLNFKNHGKTTSVQMGFPFDTDGPEDPDDKEADLPDPKFRTFVDGKEIKVTRKQGWNKSPLQDFNYPIVYTFAVPFEKGETQTISHTYSVQGTEWSTGDYEFKYILKTGALWKGVIKNIKVVMILPRSSASQITSIAPKEYKTEQKQGTAVFSWEFHNIKPDFNIIANFRKTKLNSK